MKSFFWVLLILFSLSMYADDKSKVLSDNEETVVIVKKGDTLWDICETYLGDPFLWPKVWSVNPHIENAHIIEPGDKIYLNSKSGEIKIEKKNPTKITNVANYEELEKKPLNRPKISYVVSNKPVVKSNILVSEKKFKKSGKIDSSERENILLTMGDRVHVKFKDNESVKEGDYFNIFKVVKELEHPISEDDMGYLLEILGEVKIISKTKNGFWAVIISANKEISRGNRLMPKIDRKLELKKIESNENIIAHVVDSFKQHDNLVSQDVIVIDKGKKDSLEKGQHFYVVRYKDKFEDEDIPEYVVAEAIVIKVNDKTSLALLYNAIIELEKGDVLKTILNKKEE